MEAVIESVQTSFVLRKDLVNKLKEAALKANRSLDNYVENVLMSVLLDVPNQETCEAIEEVRSGSYAGTLDMSSFDKFMKSINEIE